MRVRSSKRKRLWRTIARIYLPILILQLPVTGSPSNPPRGQSGTKTRAFTRILSRSLPLRKAGSTELALPSLSSNRLYSVTITLSPGAVQSAESGGSFAALVRDNGGMVAEKALHAGDPDLYLLMRPSRSGTGGVTFTPSAKVRAGGEIAAAKITIVEWNEPADRIRDIAYKPDGDWKHAVPITLGGTVFGSGDLTPYFPTEVEETTRYYDATKASSDLTAAARTDKGEDWLVFDHISDAPKLVYFQLDLPERDNIPPDVSVFTEKDGKLQSYEVGTDPVTPPHEIQALPGNKFTTRTITRGRYYVRVIANHPEWRLRTQVLDPPPYCDVRQAVRTGVDYLLGAGDSWHANIPRAGARLNRVGNVHAETAQCIACHPTHFTTRAALEAISHGYAPERQESLRFLVERLANNPRPFYGHPGANWVRMISAPGNVTSRLADLVSSYEEQTGGDRFRDVHRGACGYLKLYYKGRTELPPEESNGNAPLISQYEVVYHSWRVFEREAAQGDPEAKRFAKQMIDLVGQDRHKDMRDLCWQTIAMAKMDEARFGKQIRANCERILSEQRPDGQWSMLFEPKSAAVEFQTGHALYTLAVGGYKPVHPQVRKSIDFLLNRQQPFGGWFDPLQTYENFRTPFRETQFAVMALSQLFPEAEVARRKTDKTATDGPHGILQNLDRITARSSAADMARAIALVRSEEPLVRATAAEALGRIGDARSAGPLAEALGDDTKMVQRMAAVALRRLADRGIGLDAVKSALNSPNERVRWGAQRVFAYHFRSAVPRGEIADCLIRLTSDRSMMVRMAAIQSLWQWFQWTPDMALRGRILDSFLARLAKPEHPWVARNAREAIYNVADENVRYLYGNWIPALADPADREKAAKGQRNEDLLVAKRLAAALDAGNSSVREAILRGLTEFHLRNVRTQNLRYARIGNDVEQTRFSAEAAKVLEPALAKAMNDPSPAVRRYAVIAAFTLRDNGPMPISLDVMARLADPDPQVCAAAVEFRNAIPVDATGERAALAAKLAASLLAAPTAEARQAGLELAMENSEIGKDVSVNGEIERLMDSTDPPARKIVLNAAKASQAARKDVRVIGALSDILVGNDPSLQTDAIALIQKDPALRGAPSIRSSLKELAAGGGPSASAAEAILAQTGGPKSTRAVSLPDYDSFARNVMPIFARKGGPDGNACVSCHFNHNLLKVTPPDTAGKFSDAQIREAYRSALKVIDLNDPERSLLLKKPTSTSAAEGQVNVNAIAHGGGQRWQGTDDPAYRAVLAWITGSSSGNSPSP